MPIYAYYCEDCLAKATKAKKRPLTVDEEEESVAFETSHKMEPTPKELAEATICPRCEGKNTKRFYYGMNITTYTKGNGYLDKEGVARDMHLYHLTHDDPYGGMRVPGEVDDIKHRLQKPKRRNKTKNYDMKSDTKSMEKAVEQAVNRRVD